MTAPACCGQRRYGGAFTLGPVRWEKCPETPTVELQIGDDWLPSCRHCWQECIENNVDIKGSRPIAEAKS